MADYLEINTSHASVRFDQPGDKVVGTIVDLDTKQERDYATGEPKTYSDGNPMMMWVITLATDQRDPANPDDDGTRTVWARGQMKKAITTAVAAAKATRLEVGNRIEVTFTGFGEPSKPGFNPPKLFSARYRLMDQSIDVAPQPAPAPAAAATDLF